MTTGGMSAARGMSALFRSSQMASAMRLRAGAGLPVGSMEVPAHPLPENAELIWDDGSPFPEPCLDNVAPMVGKYEALAWLLGGMGLFAGIGGLAAWNDKASRIPWVNTLNFSTLILILIFLCLDCN
uniref:NADH dehydrogenase [ubiquinone] 1 beta subcomplex subunit 8, mitochondrial n=1 Tax=Physcomitrium patens TaxID=3218 RepID=A0A7I4C3Z5_PHYPA